MWDGCSVRPTGNGQCGCLLFPQGKHLNSRSGIFPRLHGSVEETKVKLAPVHTELTANLKVGP